MRRLRWVADGGASEAEPRALHGAERLVVVRGEAELLGVGPRLDVFPRLCEIKILRLRLGIRYLVFGSLKVTAGRRSALAGPR